LYILNNNDEVLSYIMQYISEINETYYQLSEKWTMNDYNKSFSIWFEKKVNNEINASETLLRLTHMPNNNVTIFCGYDINKY